MDTCVEDLAKAVRDPLRSQCPKFGDDTSKSNTIILTEKVDKNNSALNVFLVHVFVQFARQELHTKGGCKKKWTGFRAYNSRCRGARVKRSRPADSSCNFR